MTRRKQLAGIIACAAIFSMGFSGARADGIVNNGSFEGTDEQEGAAWKDRGGYFNGKGKAETTEELAHCGKKSFAFTGLSADAAGQLISPNFELQPGAKYRLSYWLKRGAPSASAYIILRYQSTKNEELKENICFLLNPGNKKKALNEWVQFSGPESLTLFYFPQKKGEGRSYKTFKTNEFTFPVEAFGTAPVKCSLQLYASGVGTVYFDDIVIEETAPGKQSAGGLGEADRQEAKRLMLDKQEKSRQEDANRKKKSQTEFKLVLPARPDYDKKYSLSPEKFPESASNVTAHDGNLMRNGKPVFLVGAEHLNPYMCKLLGIDFRVFSAFGNKPSVKKGAGNSIEIKDHPLPFFETDIREYLRSGILVWVDLLQGYKIWQSPLLKENFPELFITKEAFFCWRPENPDAQKIRYRTWWNALKIARKYPIFTMELFNEIKYEDFSPHNMALFRERMRDKYKTIETANKAWKTDYECFADVIPPGNPTFAQKFKKKISKQLRFDWNEFTEWRFGRILKEAYNWAKKVDSKPFICIQSYSGLPYDYQDNHTNPYLKVKAEDIYCSEFGSTYFPQWKGAVNEKEILYNMRSYFIIDFIRSVSPDKPIVDGECSFGPGIKSRTPESTLVDLTGKWKFKPSGINKSDNVKFEGFNQGEKTQTVDKGFKEGWQNADFNDKDWKEINVPGMWGLQGYKKCYSGWYRKSFVFPDKKGPVYISGSELADRADVYLNGKLILKTKLWNESFSEDISKYILRGQKNTLAIKVFNCYFKDEMYWGGIRKDISITSVPFKRLPITPGQMASFFWQRALHGYSGLCISYFYYNEASDKSCALLNPERHSPEAIAAIPLIKTRINSLGKLFLNRPRIKGNVALAYSLDSFRAYMPKKPGLTRDRTQDFTRYYAGITFSHRELDVIGAKTLKDISPEKYKAAFIRLDERTSRKTLKALEKFAGDGGILIVDGTSLTVNNFNGEALNASKLLGAQRKAPIKETLTVSFNGLNETFKTVGLLSQDHINAWELNLLDADALAKDSKGRILACRRKTGKGAVYTLAMELTAKDYAKAFNKILSDNNINSSLLINGKAPYVESHAIKRNGKELWCLHNWGAAAKVKIKPAKPFLSGKYRIREVNANIEIPCPSGNAWTEKDIASGIELDLKNLTPYILLIEPENSTAIKINDLPEAQKRAISSQWEPLWDAKQNAGKNGRILWYGLSEFTPATLPTAAAIVRKSGWGIDIMKTPQFKEQIKILRNRKEEHASLNQYPLIIIPRTKTNLTEKDAEELTKYLKDGGSLLVMGTHMYNHHSYSRYRMKKLFEALGITVFDSAIVDVKNMRKGEERYFITDNIKKHPATQGVKTFYSMGTAPVAAKNKNAVMLISGSSSASSNCNTTDILYVAKIGNGKVAVMGDSNWLSPDGLIKGDNAVLFANLIAWLTGKETLAPETAKDTVKLENF